MTENISLGSIAVMIGLVAFIILLIVYGFDVMTYTIHKGTFEQRKLITGQPYSYEELEQCNGGIYRNLKEYQEFYEYSTLAGSGILSKEEYEISSKKLAVFPFGTPSWEKENPTSYYCLKLKEVIE